MLTSPRGINLNNLAMYNVSIRYRGFAPMSNTDITIFCL